MITKGLAAHAVDVPSHIEEELQIVASHLWVVNIHDP